MNQRLRSYIEPLEARIAPAFAAVLDLAALTFSKGFELVGESSLDYAGYSVSDAGDVNGDGFDDLLIGASGADPGGNEASGASYVVFGRAAGAVEPLALSSLDGVTGFRINGAAESDYAGHSVSAAGDVNGDGFDDLLIGAFSADPGGDYARGSAYVVFGKATGFTAQLEFSTLNGENGFRINGEAAGDYAGFAVSGAGDINGDGFADLLIGAPNATDAGAAYVGAAYVVFGKARFSAASLNLATLNGNNGFKIRGEAPGDYAGTSVSGAGDVNGDGFDDILIGAYAADRPTQADAGAAYLVFGRPSVPPPSLDLSALNGLNGFKLIGESGQDYAGTSVSGAGDLNGDGFDEIIVGASNADSSNGSGTGAAYVVFGQPRPASSLVDLATLDGITGFRIEGGAAGDALGTSVSDAGDINGDGRGDVIVGAPGAGTGGAGASYVLFGSASSLPAAFDVGALDGLTGFAIRGAVAGDASGTAVSSVGDVNRDGFGDLLIGAPGAGVDGDARGVSYLIFGRSSTPEVRIDPGAATAEGTLGTSALQFTVSLDGPTTLPVAVSLAATGITAEPGVDFRPPLASVLTFAPGELAKTLIVEIIADAIIETDETLSLRALSATNATIASDPAIGTILNDDTAVRIADSRAAEGDTGNGSLDFILTLDQPTILPVSVEVTTADRTAIAGSDYAALSLQPVLFAPGETTRTVTVTLIGDRSVEDDEQFVVSLSGAVNAAIADGEATGTIVNDETLVRAIGGTTVEGNDATHPIAVAVNLTAPHHETVTVDYVLVAGTASVGSDYTGAPSGTLVFAPGETSQTIELSILGDTVAEPDESFAVLLTNAANAAIDVASAAVAIRNDDGALRIADGAILEGHAGIRSLAFPVSLAEASSLPVTVAFTITPQTATADVDYAASATGTLTFAPGEMVQSIAVEILGDTFVEGNEAFLITLSNPGNAVIEDGEAVGGILNDDVTIRGGKRATFIDVDGDVITVIASKGSLTARNFVLVPAGLGSQLALVTLTGDDAFSGADLAIRARRAGGGDGLVNVGAIDARGIDLGRVKVQGDLGQIDAGNPATGQPGIFSIAAESIGLLGVTTQLPGGSTVSNIAGALGKLTLATHLTGATVAVAGDIRALAIHGDVANAVIGADGKIGKVVIEGSMRGDVLNRATITALGALAPGSNKEAVAIGSVRIGGSLEHGAIVAGYDLSGAAVHADVRIGKVAVGGDWIASDLVAGARAGEDQFFGTADDTLILPESAIVARIASVLVKGEVITTASATDQFGIVAAHVATFRTSEGRTALERGPQNDIAVAAAGSGDLRIMEVG